MVESVQSKQCTNSVMIWTKASKEVLGARESDVVLHRHVQRRVGLPRQGRKEWRQVRCGRSARAAHSPVPVPLPGKQSLLFPWEPTFAPQFGAVWGGAGASCIPLSPLGLFRARSCRSRDGNVHSATRVPLSSHYFVVFVDLFEKNVCTSLLHRQDSL